ncbi:MAG: hypothetical protein AAB375_00710 [Patescibacteria group bacterium]
MPFKIPRDDNKYRWTHHVVRKLQYYGLTPSRVLRVIRAPERVEEGVAEGTLAAMQTAGTKAKPWEVWVMWREAKKQTANDEKRVVFYPQSQKVIITAWRYPGVSPVRERVPIPSDILAELEREGILEE